MRIDDNGPGVPQTPMSKMSNETFGENGRDSNRQGISPVTSS